jgi:LysM repeat protein
MNKRSSAPARLLAVITLVVALVVAVVVISGALDGGDSNESDRNRNGARSIQGSGSPKPSKVPAVYVVKSGDTLIGIAHRLGVPVARIEQLNPEVDPQILIAGEKLKLREAP